MEKRHEKLLSEGLISEDSYQKIKLKETGLFPVGMELKTLLYAGVFMLTSGLGIAIYNNIDTIGHMAIIAVIGLMCLASFYYCYKVALPWSTEKVQSPNILFNYVLLLAGLTLVSFLGYLQFQYSIFNAHSEYVLLITSLILFAAAYYFDHLGILSMAITSIAAFAGITVSPENFFEMFDRSLSPLAFTGIFLGSCLIVGGWYLSYQRIKKHFTFTYYNFGVNIFFIFALTGLFSVSIPFFLLMIAGIATLTFLYANRTKSFYFLVLGGIYCYIALAFLFIRTLLEADSYAGIYVSLCYIIASSLGGIYLLRIYRKKFQADDRI